MFFVNEPTTETTEGKNGIGFQVVFERMNNSFFTSTTPWIVLSSILFNGGNFGIHVEQLMANCPSKNTNFGKNLKSSR